jgi:cytochrome c-type biogenesis protein CcsB
MNIEMLFKNGIFLSLFLSMISFWTENIVSNISSKKEADPINFAEKLFFISFFLLTFDLLYRWFLSGHPPLSNLYESLLFLIWGLVGFFLFVYTNKTITNSSTIKSTRNNFLSAESLPVLPAQAGSLPVGDGKEAKRANPESFWFSLGTNPQIKISEKKSSKSTKSRDTEIEDNVLLKTSFISPRNFVGCILSSTALFIQTFADWRLPSEMRDIKPLIPALQSNWLLMHVSIMILSYAALLIGSIIAITYIIIFLKSNKIDFNADKENELNQTMGSLTNKRDNSVSLSNTIFLEELDSLSYRILAFGFPLLTLGILSGSVWANEAWGSYWSWDPKETWAFITWLIFAFYLHTRLQYGWEGEKSAFVASFGFFIVWICYLGVNLLGKGLHSYGWLS